MKPILVLLILAILLAACGCTEAPPAQPAITPGPATVTTAPPPPRTTTPVPPVTPSRTSSVSDNTIIISKNSFRPANITVPAGATVRWVNYDTHPHNIEFINKAFSTSTYLLGASQSFSQRFDRPGQYDFACLIHPEMQGSVLVEK